MANSFILMFEKYSKTYFSISKVEIFYVVNERFVTDVDERAASTHSTG